jgi:VIT1/CCC1 family predicted Fe2+/Mn2+ transporter
MATTTTNDVSRTSRGQLLDPVDRISEVLFGLIMALTFTVTLDAASADGAEVRSMLFAALGCNIAWGLVDGVMYMSMGLVERAHGLRLMRDLRAGDAATRRVLIRDSVPPVIAASLDDGETDHVVEMLLEVEVPDQPRLRKDDLLGAAAVAMLVFLSTFPVALPFAFIDDARLALRTSNAIALIMLFAAGAALGRYGGVRPMRLGLTMAVLGTVLVVVTVALGG